MECAKSWTIREGSHRIEGTVFHIKLVRKDDLPLRAVLLSGVEIRGAWGIRIDQCKSTGELGDLPGTIDTADVVCTES